MNFEQFKAVLRRHRVQVMCENSIPVEITKVAALEWFRESVATRAGGFVIVQSSVMFIGDKNSSGFGPEQAFEVEGAND